METDGFSFARGEKAGFLPILVALGILSVLSAMSMVMGFSMALQSRGTMRRIDSMEAFYSNELAAWHARLRNDDGIAASGIVRLDHSATVSIQGMENDSMATGGGIPVSILTTQRFAPAQMLVRRNLANNIAAKSDPLQSCGHTTLIIQSHWIL